MPSYVDEAIVLRTHKLGEADRIITMLTRTHGKVRAVARGVRRTSSKFGGRVEPFRHVRAQVIAGRSLDIVGQVVQLNAWSEDILTDYERYTAGQVMLETADRLVSVENEPALRHFLLLAGALRTLAQGTPDGERPASMVLDAFLLRALASEGYAPALDACATCGRPGAHSWFSPAAGGLVCGACRVPGTARVSPEGLAMVSALMTGDWEATRVAPSVQREASGMVAAFTSWHMEHALRSVVHLERRFTDLAGSADQHWSQSP